MRYNIMTTFQTAALQVEDDRPLYEVLEAAESGDRFLLIGDALVPVGTISYIQKVGS